uniref:Uncharacterized protein n=1 Tax=Oryza barthii TaxID=65489 RepID=A0A0D3H7Q6_9ORYZ
MASSAYTQCTIHGINRNKLHAPDMEAMSTKKIVWTRTAWQLEDGRTTLSAPYLAIQNSRCSTSWSNLSRGMDSATSTCMSGEPR